MTKDKLKKLLRFVAFLLVFGVVFVYIQNRVTPEWDWPNDGSRSSTAVSGLYYEPDDSLEVLWVGTSHLHNAVSPMEVYKRSGIHSYNLATTGQPFLASYYRLKDALERQNPQVVVLDASSCFRSNFWQKSETAWRKMIDSLPWYYFKQKLVMTQGMISLNSDTMRKRDIASGLFPIIRYHSNYMLGRLDYLDRHRDMTYFLKGQAVITMTEPVPDDRATGSGEKKKSTERLMKILNEQAPTLDKFVELCKEHNCQLVLTKIPVNTTEEYDGYWDEEKHDIIVELSDKLGVPFLDLNYEDVGIDWKSDTCDGGEHVNERGALKVSDFYADWLMSNYDIQLIDDAKLKDSWDLQLEVFEYEHDRYRIEMEYNLENYLRCLNDSHYTVFTAVAGNVGEYWTEELQADLSRLTGAKTELASVGKGAYLCVSRDGEIAQETSGDSECVVEGVLEDGAFYTAFSHGAGSDGKWSVVINGTEYANQGKGVCFVIYDNELHCVVDAASFNTAEAGKTCRRVDSAFLRPMRERMLDYEYETLKGL